MTKKKKGICRKWCFFKLAGMVIVTLGIIATTKIINDGITLRRSTAAGEVTFTPNVIPITDPNFTNPLRGLYTWRHLNIAPQAEPPADAYNRFEWKDLEPSIDAYNFSKIDTEISLAKSKNQKFGFNVRSMLGYDNNGEMYVPGYLKAYGWMADSNADGSADTFIPDWNNPYFLERAQKLVQALGRKYNGSPDISYVEIGIFGQWGEWTIKSGVDYSKAPVGITRITQTSKNAIIDMFVAAFPQSQLVTSSLGQSNTAAYVYAFNQPAIYPIGWRVNCLGQGDYFNQWINHPADWDQIKDRWKVAPVIGEFCYVRPGSSSTNFAYALDQVITYHVSTVGNGNADAFSTFSASEQQKFLEIDKKAGYRYILNNVTLPGVIQPGSQITVSSQWSNVGSAPAYEPWDVNYLFIRENTTTAAWSVKSTTKLKEVLPGSPRNIVDTFTVPSQLVGGRYYMYVFVRDPRETRRPMKLAISDRRADGSYGLGMIQVNIAATPTPIPSPSPTSTPISTPTSNPTPVPTTMPTSGVSTLHPSDDTTADSARVTNVLGNLTTLTVNGKPKSNAFLKFDLTALTGANVTKAILKIYVTNKSKDTQSIYLAETSSWSENSLTYDNRPNLGADLGFIRSWKVRTGWVETDVTSQVKSYLGKPFSLVITATGDDALEFSSKENSTNKPELIITTNR